MASNSFDVQATWSNQPGEPLRLKISGINTRTTDPSTITEPIEGLNITFTAPSGAQTNITAPAGSVTRTVPGTSTQEPVLFELSVPPPPVTDPTGFVTVAGTQLMLGGKPWIIHGATTYGSYNDPTRRKNVIKLAKDNGLNTLELVRHARTYNSVASETAADTLTDMDAYLAEVRANGMKAILNLSGYYWALKASGQKPTNVDWNPYLKTIMTRVNTITGVRYSDDPTIAMIELVGEIDDPNGTEPNVRPTNPEILAFFKRTLDQLRALAPKHVLSTGGFSYLNLGKLDWKPLMDLPNNQVVAFEINSYADRDTTAPMVTQYAKQIGKPWWLAAFSSCRRPSNGSWDINAQPTDADCANHHREMYELARGRLKAATPGVGADFWNLHTINGTCDIGTYTPLTLAVVREYATK